MNNPATPLLVDRFGRHVNYLRLSVTDRCDFRCVYCMAEDMTFLPRSEVLTLEELALVSRAFVSLGVTRIRVTGGEPLVRSNILSLLHELGHLNGVRELALTTNGSRLAQLAPDLVEAGVKRLNISVDSLRADRFRSLTRTGDLHQVLAGVETARTSGFDRIRINSVILRGRNDDEILPLLEFCLARGLDLCFIEEMPLGHIDEHDRAQSFISSAEVRERLERHYTLQALGVSSGGPARYYGVAGTDCRVGFISPHSHNFCGDCNRVRLTVEGRLLLCLGNEHSVDLRAVTRRHPGQLEPLREAIIAAMALKPERHHFDLEEPPQIVRFMNMTGG